MKKILFVSIIFSLLISGCSETGKQDNKNINSKNQNQETKTIVNDIIEDENSGNYYVDLSPLEAKGLIERNEDLIIIDASSNYKKGHIPGSINYYVGDGSLDKVIPDLDKNKMYLVYCHEEDASILAAKKLVNAKMKKVFRLKGNYSAWVEAGYPTEISKR